MTEKDPLHVARCRCEAVEIGAWSEPIFVAACHCEDCRAAAQKLALPSSSGLPAPGDNCTEFMLFRRDRIACMRGGEHLQEMRLAETSKTRRMIAGCCATPMYMAFDDKRPWVSAFRAAFGAAAPPVEMHICTRFGRSDEDVGDGVPRHPSYPPKMMLRLLAAWPRTLFSSPLGTLP